MTTIRNDNGQPQSTYAAQKRDAEKAKQLLSSERAFYGSAYFRGKKGKQSF